MYEQNQNLSIFGIKLWFSRLKFFFLNFPNFTISKIIEFPLLTNSKKNKQISAIVECQKLANFQNLTICKTNKILRISNLTVNYHTF